MTLHPVIVRELRVEARNPLNYWVRMGGVALASIIVMCLMLSSTNRGQALGGHLFSSLNGLIYIGIVLVVPVVTADCLSRELREGTLGLMFLTPLQPLGIVLSKSLVHGLRAASLVLVVVPVVSVVFLVGGVSWRQMVLALLLDLNALLLALGASVLASALSRLWGRAVSLAWLLFGAGLISFFTCLFGFFLLLEHREMGQSFWTWILQSAYLVGRVGTIDMGTMWLSLLGSAMMSTVVVTLLFWWWLRLTAILVGRSWQETSLTPEQMRRQEYFFAPRFWRVAFERRRKRALDANPIGWLQGRSLSGRLARWGWFGLCILVESYLAAESGSSYYQGQVALMAVVLLGMSFEAANSFMRERRSGALELLMVAPLTHDQILSGGLKGVWLQFLPAGLVICLVLALHPATSVNDVFWLGCFSLTFVVIPMIGLFFSVRQRSFVAAWLLTALVAGVLPFVVSPLLLSSFASFDAAVLLFFVLASQLCLGGLVGMKLAARLKARDFEVNVT